MLDSWARSKIDPPLNRIGAVLARRGVHANHLSIAGAGAGLCAGLAIASGQFLTGLAFIILSRLLDGLDGPVARAGKGGTDFGGYLDIACDYIFYAAIPLAFGWSDEANRLPALALLASFILSGTSFLAYAVIAEKRGLTTSRQGTKSFYYMAGLAEGSETIAAFILFCLFPAWFPVLTYAFAALCALTMVGRVLMARIVFSDTA
mgnify:CR=1 FL=1